jgi:hypothetical protein
MRSLRLPLTVVLGVLFAFDAVIGYRVRHYGPPHRLTLEQTGTGAVGAVVGSAPFTSFDWFCLGLLVALHLTLVYLVRRSWKAAPR